MKAKILCNPLSFKGMAFTTAFVASISLGEARAKVADLDGDGIANLVDHDLDGDGIPNGRDRNVDGGICRHGPFKGKHVGDHLLNDDPNEKDIDADGLKDNSDAELDIDGDGRKDDGLREKDIDGDGRPDNTDAEVDIDGDGLDNTDLNEDDMDGDGLSDHCDYDCDGDGKDRDYDDDDDADGISDSNDGDDDGNWVPDSCEQDGGVLFTETISGGTLNLVFDPGFTEMGAIDTWIPSLTIDPETSIAVDGTFTWTGSISSAVFVESLPTRNSFDAAAWLNFNSFSETDLAQGIDPQVVDSRWEIMQPEDPETLDARRLGHVRNLSQDEIPELIETSQDQDTPASDETVAVP